MKKHEKMLKNVKNSLKNIPFSTDRISTNFKKIKKLKKPSKIVKNVIFCKKHEKYEKNTKNAQKSLKYT